MCSCLPWSDCSQKVAFTTSVKLKEVQWAKILNFEGERTVICYSYKYNFSEEA